MGCDARDERGFRVSSSDSRSLPPEHLVELELKAHREAVGELVLDVEVSTLRELTFDEITGPLGMKTARAENG